MMKIPADRAKAADASLPTLVDAGNVVLRIRRTQAKGGSNSTAVGMALGAAVAAVVPAAAEDDSPVAVVGVDLVVAVVLDAMVNNRQR
jgi:hypothetical protein